MTVLPWIISEKGLELEDTWSNIFGIFHKASNAHTGHLVNSGTTRKMGEFWAPECFKLT
jgi:hypothetical protein